MAEGWVRIHRCIEDSAVWLDGEPFSRGQAWVDLILMANYEEGNIVRRGKTIRVRRGQVGRSLRTLADRWNWSLGRVQRFLKLLKKLGQIETENDTVGDTVDRAASALITIVNYEQYQSPDTAPDTATDTRSDTDPIHTRAPNKKNKKNKKEEETIALSGHSLPLNAGTFDVPLSKLEEWQELFPRVDVPQQLRNMKAWCIANPAKRKTAKGVEKFIVNWLTKEQDKGGGLFTPPPPPPKPKAERDAEAIAEMKQRGFLDDAPC